MSPFGLPDKEDIGKTLAAIYRTLEKVGNGERVTASDPDMQELKQAVEKLGVSVE